MFNIIILGITSLLTDISTEMVYPIIPLYLSILGAQPYILGLIEGIAESLASVLKVFSGFWSDRLGRRKPLAVAGYSSSTVGKILLYFSGMSKALGWVWVLAGRVVDRFGKGVRTAPRDALIADSSQAGRRGMAFGLHRALDTLGASAGVFIAYLLVRKLTDASAPKQFQPLFLLSLIPAALGVLVLSLVRERRKNTGRTQETPENGSCDAPRGRAASRSGPAIPAAPAPLAFRTLPVKLRLFLLVVLLFALGNSSNQFLILRAHKSGFSIPEALLLYLVYNLVYGVFSFPVGRLADRFGHKRVLVAGYIFYGLVYLGFALVPARPWFWVLFAAYGLYSAFTEGVEKALVAEIAPAEMRGTMIGLHGTLTGIGLLPASLIAGGLMTWHLSAPFYFGGAMGLLAALGLVLVL